MILIIYDMYVLINADLACPPNEIYAFRTFCMIAKTNKLDVLAEIVYWESRDSYLKWFKNKKLFDYVKELVPINTVKGKRIYIEKLNLNNLKQAINLL